MKKEDGGALNVRAVAHSSSVTTSRRASAIISTGIEGIQGH
ncbi:hypothetical protein SynA1825c_00286 [Synechococcus sp. A18-25c]|nr:hypothetical protein SynA1825c_00286 [Synechococcus sp. A18-25c]